MRIILLAVITLLFFSATAQELTTDTLTHKGKLCYVYPYKFEWEKPYRGRRFYQENTEIPPIFDSLPSGNYVMLHAFKPTFKNKRKNKHGKLKRNVGAEFSVEKGKLNGKVIYYYYDGQKRKEGYFKNGLKDGEWLFISTYYSREKKKAVPYLSGIYTYKDGVEDGLQKKLNANEKAAEEYIKKGKGFIDYYKVYYQNGQAFIDLRADSVTELNKGSLWPLQFGGSLVYDTAVAVIDFSRMTPKQIKKYRKLYGYISYYENYDNDYYISDYGSGYQFPTNIPFVAYHENGEVLGRFSGFSASDKWSLQFDTIYNPIKKPALIKVPLPDSNDHVRFRLDYYKPTGALVKQTYYVLDSTGEYKNYRRDKVIDGKMQTLRADFSYFYSSDWSGKKLDSLYLLSVEKSAYESTTASTYMSPNIPSKKFENEIDSATGFQTYYTILNYDTAAFQYKITADLGRVSVHGFYHCDTGKLAVLALEDVLNRFLSYSEEEYYEEEEETEQYKTVLDSMQLFADGKPFTGNVIASCGKGEEAFTFKDGNLLFDVSARICFFNFGVYGADFKLTIAFKNGRIQSLSDKGKKFATNFTFSNNMADGKSTGYIKKGGKKRLAFEINTIDGVYHGTAKSYAYLRKKHQKDDQKYYLSQLQHFNKGIAVDTHAYYYPNGSVERFSVYNQKGELNGNNVQYYRDGSISSFSNSVNDKLEGILYEINGLGDTIAKGYFIHGKEEGKYYQEHYDYEQEIYDFRLVSTYSSGKLNGDLTLKDSYNTVRLALKIDSGYSNGGNYNYINEQTILNDWRADLAFTGEVNVYHPNGKKYFNGRMQMTTDTLPGGAFSYGMNKVDTWTYRNNAERIVAELNFVNDAKLTFGADTLLGIAHYKAFYPNGAIKYIGVLNYEDTRLNCASDIQEVDFVATYSTFFSAEGDTLVKNGTGILKLYNIDGNVLSEGDLKNGKKNGWWKTYNDEDKLIEVGQYIDDEKDGRWLSGDLSGINYLDSQCFENEESKEEKQELEKYKIEIEEIIYNKGEELSLQSYEFTRTR